MFRTVFIGDRVSAAGFRLGGATVDIPAPGGEEEAFANALTSSDLVLVTAELAGRLPAGRLASAQAGHAPLVLVLEDVRGMRQPPDIAATLRRQLGMAE